MKILPPVPDDVLEDIFQGMQDAERSGELDGLFKGACRESQEPTNRGKYLSSFIQGMKIYRSTFLKMIGYDLSTPGFAEDAIAKLEALGSTKAREHYTRISSEWKGKYEKILQEAAEFGRKHGKIQKEGDKKRKQQEMEYFRQMSNKDLIMLLESLTGGI